MFPNYMTDTIDVKLNQAEIMTIMTALEALPEDREELRKALTMGNDDIKDLLESSEDGTEFLLEFTALNKMILKMKFAEYMNKAAQQSMNILTPEGLMEIIGLDDEDIEEID